METNLEKAERTAVDAARAMIKTFDFASSVLEETSKSVAETSGLKVGKYDLFRLSTQDARLIRRYTKSRSYGEARVQRYMYSLFSIPSDMVESSRDIHPFILISLVNVEARAPSICYGIMRKIQGHDQNHQGFLDCFFLWINEKLTEICRLAEEKEYGWEIEQEITGKTETSRLRAHVQFQQARLFDITSEEFLSERASMIANWFINRLGTAG